MLYKNRKRHRFWSHFNTALAAWASVITLFVTFLPQPTRIPWCTALCILALICIVCCFYATHQTARKKRISLSISSNLRINISEGDILQCKGIVVIPVNEYFDTKVDDVIIDKKTIHGQFVQRFFKNKEDVLYEKIERALQKTKSSSDSCRKHFGARTKKYELGTCADVVVGNTRYVLFALTHFDKDDKAYLERSEFAEAIKRLMTHLSKVAGNHPVYMPLFGTGLSRLNRSHQRVLLHIIDTIDFSCPEAINAGLNIVIHPNAMKNINLNQVEDYFNDTFHEIRS